MSSDTPEKRRVQFRAPEGLIERADALATVLETDRTDVIISALREHLREAGHEDAIKQEVADAYYRGDIEFDELEALLGHEAATNVHILAEQLDEEFLRETAEELADS